MFRVGQRCICIKAGALDGDSGLGWLDNDGPTEGAVYTVTRVLIDSLGDEVLHLAEIARGPMARRIWGDDAGYNVSRFRPIVERKTDISVFEEILRRETAPSSLPLAEA